MALVILKLPEKDKQQILDDIQETYDIVSDLTKQYERNSKTHKRYETRRSTRSIHCK